MKMDERKVIITLMKQKYCSIEELQKFTSDSNIQIRQCIYNIKKMYEVDTIIYMGKFKKFKIIREIEKKPKDIPITTKYRESKGIAPLFEEDKRVPITALPKEISRENIIDWYNCNMPFTIGSIKQLIEVAKKNNIQVYKSGSSGTKKFY